MADVRLVDLEVIKRFSLAVRQDTAPADEVLAALDASRVVVLAALGRSEPAPAPKPARRPVGSPPRKAGTPPAKAAGPPKVAKVTKKPASDGAPTKTASPRRRTGSE